MKSKVVFSDGRERITGIISVVPGNEAFVICHGLAGNAGDPEESAASEELEQMGYSTLRISHRTGLKNELFFDSQVRQLIVAVSLLKCRYHFSKVHLIGISMGASNALIAGSMDSRVSSVCAVSGISDGETWMKERHGKHYNKFMTALCRSEELEFRTGVPQSIPVVDILAPDDKYRRIIELDQRLNSRRPDALRAQSVRSLITHSPIRHIGHLAGRPVFIAHGESDSLVSPENSRRLYSAAGRPKKLCLFKEMDHDMMLHANIRKEVIASYLRFLSQHE
jgi:alpha-beta hydrolase superfamily lysophospholipase